MNKLMCVFLFAAGVSFAAPPACPDGTYKCWQTGDHYGCCPIFDPSVKAKLAPALAQCQFVKVAASPKPKDLPEPCPGPKPPVCPVPLPIGPVVCKCEGSNGKPDTFVLIFNPARYR